MRKIYQTNAFLKDNKNPKFYTSTGWLTLYSLACGYMEKYLVNNYEILMYQDGCFHVIVRHNNSRISWDSFDTVTQARIAFLKAIKQAINNSKK